MKQLLKALKLKQNQFAKSVCVSPSHVSDVLTGRRNGFSSEVIVKIAQLYNVNLHWLLTGEGDMFLPGKGPAARGPSQELSDTNFNVIDGQVADHSELDILPKVAHTAWWQSLTETEREIIVFITHLKDPDTKKKLRDLVEIALKKEISEEEFKKQIEVLDDPKLRQKGAAG